MLEENRCKVIRRQIDLVQKAVTAYLEGSKASLQKVCTQISHNLDEKSLSNGVSHLEKDPLTDDAFNNQVNHVSTSFLER